MTISVTEPKMSLVFRSREANLTAVVRLRNWFLKRGIIERISKEKIYSLSLLHPTLFSSQGSGSIIKQDQQVHNNYILTVEVNYPVYVIPWIEWIGNYREDSIDGPRKHMYSIADGIWTIFVQY